VARDCGRRRLCRFRFSHQSRRREPWAVRRRQTRNRNSVARKSSSVVSGGLRNLFCRTFPQANATRTEFELLSLVVGYSSSASLLIPAMRRPTPLSLRNLFSETGVLGSGLLVDGSVGIGVLPQIQESFVRLPCGGFIAHHLLCAAELQPSQRSRDMSNGKAGMIDQLLELSRGRPAIAELQISETTDIGGETKSNEFVQARSYLAVPRRRSMTAAGSCCCNLIAARIVGTR